MAPSQQFPRPSYNQLEKMHNQLVAENDCLSKQLSAVQDELVKTQRRCQEYEAEQKAQEAAVLEFHNVLSQFCGPAQPVDQSTPKLGATALKEEDGSWVDLESSVENLRTLWSPGKGPSVPATRSPLRHTTVRARHSLNIGARRDPVGSIGELVAKAARDRSARCKANQENTPDLADPKNTPTRGAHHRGNSSIARSPLSSINSPMYPASAIADPETGYICMHTNMLAWSSRRSSTPCLDSRSYDPDLAHGKSVQLDPHSVSYDDCPKTPDSCHNTAKQVLGSLPPKDGDVEGMENMLAAVIKNAKNKAAEGIAAMSAAQGMNQQDTGMCA